MISDFFLIKMESLLESKSDPLLAVIHYWQVTKVANHVVSMIGFTDFPNYLIVHKFLKLSQIAKKTHIFLHKTVSKYLLGLL